MCLDTSGDAKVWPFLKDVAAEENTGEPSAQSGQ